MQVYYCMWLCSRQLEAWKKISQSSFKQYCYSHKQLRRISLQGASNSLLCRSQSLKCHRLYTCPWPKAREGERASGGSCWNEESLEQDGPGPEWPNWETQPCTVTHWLCGLPFVMNQCLNVSAKTLYNWCHIMQLAAITQCNAKYKVCLALSALLCAPCCIFVHTSLCTYHVYCLIKVMAESGKQLKKSKGDRYLHLCVLSRSLLG